MPTAAGREPRPRTPISSPRPPSSSGSYDAAFAPGQVLADRYRIVGLLGRGGMGEVYRADDLKLGQPVALKFLPRHFSADAALLERFHAEVRIARTVSHPHVCRVYDIGEVEGLHYLSMEYVDGEDLATLLRRIGRLPPLKAVEISRQLCAGLAAAHERGVLHRDLKPANVMLDGHGRARITDFGLAVRGEEAGGEIAGTPAYMSPEQLAGRPATVQSDIYSLGLVLYEIFTGKKAFEATSFAEWRRKHSEEQPTHPSIHTSDMDPAAERVILRCLEKDPAKRPASATQVAMALPGGDPLAAAIAAGETPSPEMVAAAGGEGALSLRAAWSLLGGVVALILACILFFPYSTDLGIAPMEKSPASLRDHARELVAKFGYDKNPADSADWLVRDYDPMRYIADRQPSQQWRRAMRGIGSPMLLVYRQSPRPLVPRSLQGTVGGIDPPHEISGMVMVITDAQGRLRYFRAVPPQLEKEKAPAAAEYDWPHIFTEAGLDTTRFQRAEPQWLPASPFDARAEWTGSLAELPDIPLRVSAAAFRGKLVYFEIFGPWSRAYRMELPRRSTGIFIAQTTLIIMLGALFFAVIFFARRNLRQGRGDRAGAFRIAMFVFLASFLGSGLTRHVAGALDDMVFIGGGAWALSCLLAVVMWLAYIALEPYFRRRMPELLIGWARLLEGRFRDPYVGRDVLVAAAFGAAVGLVFHVVNGLPSWFAFPGQTTIPSVMLLGPGHTNSLVYLCEALLRAVVQGVSLVVWYFLLRLLLRKMELAVGAFALLMFLLSLGGENVWVEIPGGILTAALMVVLTVRFGLLPAVTFWIFRNLLIEAPPSLDFSNFYATWALPGLLLMSALVVYAFRISLGGQPMFGAASLED
jgi:serine/threonine-protein kinase